MTHELITICAGASTGTAASVAGVAVRSRARLRALHARSRELDASQAALTARAASLRPLEALGAPERSRETLETPARAHRGAQPRRTRTLKGARA
ncbi:hypothetical protein H181DRAFT_03142 [Streptomyces sp. WMMB 714]|uniref:hypothetical protein n=1 Tax=Streptomyces sp. WMMB 714 TaxID=1286822 RepID=UPI0005F800C8|nr:hypothetical protein [Streptomyces sp. WMMB 714]SCK37184.1 hypothetical protein H181DRAFT_03142 [Streptomyces sp. WMMB 714]